jgi:hypothetical protein
VDILVWFLVGVGVVGWNWFELWCFEGAAEMAKWWVRVGTSFFGFLDCVFALATLEGCSWDR